MDRLGAQRGARDQHIDAAQLFVDRLKHPVDPVGGGDVGAQPADAIGISERIVERGLIAAKGQDARALGRK